LASSLQIVLSVASVRSLSAWLRSETRLLGEVYGFDVTASELSFLARL
jgi:hypothetical protein